MSCLSGIGVDKILQHDLWEGEKTKLKSLKKQMQEMQIFITGNYNNSISAFKTYCAKQIRENGVKIIIVDSLQMMCSNIFHINLESEINRIIIELKNIADDHNICVITSSQLNRQVELRHGSRRPILADLIGSETIEQHADKVIVIHRPETYGMDIDEDGNSTKGLVELIILKNKNGNTGDVVLKKDINFTILKDFNDYMEDFSGSHRRLKQIDRPSSN